MRVYGGRPLTRLELALAALLLGIALAGFLREAQRLMEDAERTAMHATLNHAVAAINARLAHEVLRGEVGDLAQWMRRDPFELARMERTSPGVVSGTTGTWRYDAVRHELVYRPRHASRLRTQEPDGTIRFKPRLAQPALGYMLVHTSKYVWE